LNSSSSSIHNDRRSIRKHKSRHIHEALAELNSLSSGINNDRTSIRKQLSSSSSSINNGRTSIRKQLSSSSSSINNGRTSIRKHKSQLNSLSSSINNNGTSRRKCKSHDIDEELDVLGCSLTSVTYNSSCSCKRKSNDIVEEIDGMNQIEERQSKRLKKLCHHIHPLIESELKLEWSLVHVRGIGLLNKDLTKCLNLCYMNSVIQCLANTAPFVQWLLNEENHGSCELTRFGQLCSVCALRSIIMNIHPHIYNKSNLFCELGQASAFQIARRITELSSSFVPGQQEDPSEFLIV
ncbi:unnamed protein product, partial [Rotaria sp. Silwood1]